MKTKKRMENSFILTPKELKQPSNRNTMERLKLDHFLQLTENLRMSLNHSKFKPNISINRSSRPKSIWDRSKKFNFTGEEQKKESLNIISTLPILQNTLSHNLKKKSPH